MAAATDNRNTPTRAGFRRGYPLAAGVRCLAGTLGVINSNGLLLPARAGAGLIAVGIVEYEVDNSAGADGEMIGEVQRGFARLDNSAGADAITAADIGQRCYIVDNQTVAKGAGTGGNARSLAGIVDEIDDAGVWVLIDPTSGVLASAPTNAA